MKNRWMILLLSTLNMVVYADDLGKKTYEIACQNCHSPQFAKAIKAPAAFNKKEWNLRFTNAEREAKKNPTQYKTAMDYFLDNLKIGKKLMPHGGLCNEAHIKDNNCSNKALSDAIYYMSERH